MAGQFSLALALVSVGCLVLASSAQQSDAGSLPETFPTRTLQSGGEGQCASSDARAQVLRKVRSNIGAALTNAVLPQLCLENFGRLRDCPASTCRQILRLNSSSESGYYWIRGENADGFEPVRLFCDMESSRCCNASKGWTRITYLNMNDSTTACPPNWALIPANEDHPIPTCGRRTDNRYGCDSAFFPSNGIPYRSVCGRVLAYQFRNTDAFYSWRPGSMNPPSIGGPYVDGVSVTYGRPRQHLWSFAAGSRDTHKQISRTCPCTSSEAAANITIPPFVGQDYFCDTGYSRGDTDRFYETNPLWDGLGCSEESECCSFNNPPWFCRQLSSETSEDIEVRICGNYVVTDEDTPVQLVEIFVQ